MAKCIPGFFKVYLPEKSSNRLHIPDAFIAHLSPSKPEKVMLINHIGEYWHVDVAYCDKGVFFLDGWQKFVKDNSLETADILVLKYDGDCWFNVKIMGKSGIEKTESYKEDLWVEDEEEETEEEEKGGEEAEEDCKDDCVFEFGDNDSAADKDYIEEEDDDDEMTAITSCRGRINIGKSKKRAVAKAGGSKAVYDINLLEVDVGDYGLYPNPYFVSKAWAGTRKNYLHVPSHVLKDLGLKLAKKITILDERGSIMATASATLSPATFISATAAAGSCRRRRSVKVNYITGLNSFGGLKAQNSLTSLGMPVSTEQAFAKIVSSVRAPGKGKGQSGGVLTSTCNAASEIFRIAAIMNGLVLVGVAVGFVLLRIEASVEESE
ncbi:B3 domain-containing protein [Citrus sinensis]|uniref:B3 domain-containing protein n=2 Tax=Citrus sinensis TaxID=2711 RepID=A0ACB8IGD8_CITSI|nr:B3 domain-containing protein [Citrus sinensis]